ncbi:MAG: hypothetical protein D3924_18850, partial [Candidatus Electrothrix sp. AR4]|nr:hypothetical protein [Candidatus Electrothrix sp. AR4]
KVRRVKGHLIPTYNVLGNGGMHEETLRLAEIVGWVHAYDLPRFITEVMRRYANFKVNSDEPVDFNEYWIGGGRDVVEELCKSGYNDIPSFSDDKNYYFDHGADQLFSIQDLGQAECSAGIYDMIDVDDKAVKKNLRLLDAWKDQKHSDLHALLQDTLFHAARMLLVTRGEEPATEQEVYTLFSHHFLDTGLLAESYRTLINSACAGELDSLHKHREQITAFGKELTELYKNMDNTMRFPGERENMVIRSADQNIKDDSRSAENTGEADRFKDLSGVKCPLNFAQTKVQLSAMDSGETLEIILDDGLPIDNVPGSVQLDGHTILRQEKIGEQWKVLIRKA